MKKKLMVLVAMIMVISTVATMINFVSAEDTALETESIDAVINYVTLDGTLTANAYSYIEYLMETKVDNVTLGAAWDPAEAKLYIAVNADKNLVSIDLSVGGAKAEVDAVNGAVTGITGAGAAVNDNGRVIEIAIPINTLILKHNGANVYTELKMTVTTTEDTTFEGNIIFKDHSPKLANNPIHQAPKSSGSGVTVNAEGKNVLLDDQAELTGTLIRRSGTFFGNEAVTTTKNVYIGMTMNVKALPVEIPFVDNPTLWSNNKGYRLWFAYRYTTTDQLFFDIVNTVDYGLQLLIQTDAGFAPSFETVTLGKQVGEEFDFGLEWHDDGTLNVFVDGVKIYSTKNTVIKAPNLGKATGTIFIETSRNKAFGVGEKIEFEFWNLSVSHKIAEYDEAALIALSKEKVVIPVETTTAPETTTTEETTTVADTTKAETTTVADTTVADTTEADSTAADSSAADSAADTTEAEKSGCASSLAGYGITMMLGSAVMAVLATAKKDEEKED